MATKLQAIVDKMGIKDRIQRTYAVCAKEVVALKRYKREHGYCGGSPSCMEYTGNASFCRRCRTLRANPQSKHAVYEYGQIRAKEKKYEREHGKKKSTRRKAA